MLFQFNAALLGHISVVNEGSQSGPSPVVMACLELVWTAYKDIGIFENAITNSFTTQLKSNVHCVLNTSENVRQQRIYILLVHSFMAKAAYLTWGNHNDSKMICKPNLLWWFLNICPEISHSIYWCTVQKKGSQNTSLQYLRFLFFFPPLRTTSLTPNVSVVVFWPCSIFGSGTFHYNLCQKPVKHRHNELFSAFFFSFFFHSREKTPSYLECDDRRWLSEFIPCN